LANWFARFSGFSPLILHVLPVFFRFTNQFHNLEIFDLLQTLPQLEITSQIILHILQIKIIPFFDWLLLSEFSANFYIAAKNDLFFLYSFRTPCWSIQCQHLVASDFLQNSPRSKNASQIILYILQIKIKPFFDWLRLSEFSVNFYIATKNGLFFLYSFRTTCWSIQSQNLVASDFLQNSPRIKNKTQIILHILQIKIRPFFDWLRIIRNL
jgi:hypothetical protein